MTTPLRHVLLTSLLTIILAGKPASTDTDAAPDGSPPAGAAIALAPCQAAGVEGEVKCGTLEVYENRAAKSGRKIALKVMVLPATGTDSAPDPVFFVVPGGPGGSACESAAWVATAWADLRKRRDLVLVDQRGTGGSHPLNIDLFGPPENVQNYLGEFIPHDVACKARGTLAQESDLTQYTTPIAMDDLDDVRAALGYERINLLGTSYGGRAVMVYMRQHPERVRAAILEGAAPLDDFLPAGFPLYAERAVDGVFSECESDAGCHAAFPNLRAEFEQVFAKLEKGPVQTEIIHPKTGELARVSLSRNVAAEAVRYLLYYPNLTRQLPVLIHEAAQGDYSPLAEFALWCRMNIVASGSMGMFLAVTCAEDLPWIKPGEGERMARGTFLGDYRLQQQRAACDCWPRGWLPPHYSEPLRSDAPVLIITGALDPATPPSLADGFAKYLPGSLHVVVPHGGHSADGLINADCISRLETAFIERGTAVGLDTTCVSSIQRPPFAVKALETKVVTLSEEELERLTGDYVIEGTTFPMVVLHEDRRLSALAPDGPILLVPVSETKFKAVGIPGMYATFELEEDMVARVVFERGGSTSFVLVPALAER
ncbi:MAG: alpha/beta fold hydrolase [Acidobacteriota bacterium]